MLKQIHFLTNLKEKISTNRLILLVIGLRNLSCTKKVYRKKCRKKTTTKKHKKLVIRKHKSNKNKTSLPQRLQIKFFFRSCVVCLVLRIEIYNFFFITKIAQQRKK